MDPQTPHIYKKKPLNFLAGKTYAHFAPQENPKMNEPEPHEKSGQYKNKITFNLAGEITGLKIGGQKDHLFS